MIIKDRSTIVLKPIKEHNNEEKNISLIKDNLYMLIAKINLAN